MDSADKIYVAGHRGLVGGALVRSLRARGFHNLLLRSHAELDLRDGPAVAGLFDAERPDYVILAAAKVGGIRANDTYPADFGRDNLLIQTHVLDAAARVGVKKLLFLGSSCVYPKLAPQPLREDALLTGPLEPTNDAYAIAKIAGLILCRSYNRQYGTNFIGAMPTNLYGPGDNFDPDHGHVLPAMITKFHTAKLAGAPSVRLWGSGTPRRELLHVDDLASACLALLERADASGCPGEIPLWNVGTGRDVTIAELATTVAEVVGYQGSLVWDRSMPDGTPRKVLDVSRMSALGWEARIELRQGIEETYDWYLANCARPRAEEGEGS